MPEHDELKEIMVQAIREALNETHANCPLSDDDDRHDLKQLLSIYRESTSTVIRWGIKLILLGAFCLAIIGGVFTFKQAG
jgi:hypothetical protein